MMKSLITILSLAILLAGNGLKYWDMDSAIDWNDFKKVKNMPGNEAAKIHVATSSIYEYENGYLKVEIRTYMDPAHSFVLKNEQTDHLLMHEQIHYDIQEVYARKIRKRIQDGTYKFNSLSKNLKKIIKEETRECSKMQADYDQESDHSLNEKKQKEWEIRVFALLEKYEDYKDYAFRVEVEM